MTQLTTEQLATWGDRAAGQATGFQRFVAGWAALGVTLSGATQLRLAELPVGPSELILAVWILFVAFLLLRGVRFAGSRVTIIVIGYWLAALTLMGFGALIAVHTNRTDPKGMFHDGAAFTYLAMLTTFLTLRLYDGSAYSYHWHFARLIFLFHVLAAGLLLGVAMAIPNIGPIRFWYGGIRFAGWAENPNQMALAMAAMPFLGWWLLRRTSGRFGKAGYLLGIVVCIAAGFATRSDGMQVAWVASLGAICTLLFYRVTMRGRSRWLHISHIIIPVLVLVVGATLSDEIATRVYEFAEGVYAEGDQGEKRFILWLHGLQAIRESPLFGFGPGSFSGNGGPFEGREAHNSFIDWGMSTGALGLAIYLGMLAWCLWCALRSGETMPVAMLTSVVVVSVFGYVLRQPDFWGVLILVLILGESASVRRLPQPSRAVFEYGGHGWRQTAGSARAIERHRFQ
jgi:O-Antigen ligase